MSEMSFRGQSGQAYRFTKMSPDAPWARQAGVALFAARGPFGWRVLKLTKMQGKAHDIQPIWALADAERYGATTVFVMAEHDPDIRQSIMLDLENGLSPVCESQADRLPMAA